MQKLLQVDFQFNGPFGDEMSAALEDIAHSINNEPGMIWKIWTESEKEKLGGGVYLFKDETSAQIYLEMHSARLSEMGITDIRGVIFDINDSLTQINSGPI
ncbi:monooxygenase [Marinomonas sp. SBI22]|uniref:monooxygenase n=1 Tax=unclassified Marinomonas TaxID=196814 RepID=UPI0007AF4197|nr:MULTISPECIES: monooxygenase [unclassified Marinomonas]KZM43704.1 monooxygenase [Marinomonas sp. SBI22]KZM47266.1 monooxygenase [Marinomonas sp. SBI8L]